MLATLMILFWWLLFAGTHIAGSSLRVRPMLIAKLGLTGFKGLYSLVALATFIPLCVVYAGHKHAGPLLFTPGPGMRIAAYVLMLLALVVLAQGLATPSPISTQAELSGKFSPEPQGIQRLSRHPQNLGFFLFGLAHLLVNPYLGDLVFFGGFVVYAVVSAIHQDLRIRASGPGEAIDYLQRTSALPFVAQLGGKQSLGLGEYNRTALIAAVVLYLILRLFHHTLFGGFAG